MYTIPFQTLSISFIIILLKVQWRWFWWFIYLFWVFFALKVNINLQNMYIKRRLERFDQITCIFVVLFFVCVFLGFFLSAVCLQASLIKHVPVFELHAQWHFSMSLNSQHVLQCNSHVGGLCWFLFYSLILLEKETTSFLFLFLRIPQNFFPVSFSSRIS
jgi:hypothetical protein